MGTISVYYDKKPSVVSAFKMDMSLPIIDFNVEHVEGKEYAIYGACKYKNEIIAVIGLIRYDYLNKEVFIKIMDESVGPYYYDMKKKVFDKLTPIKEKSLASDWRKKVQSKLNKK